MQNHPLFEPETDDDDAPEVQGIHVTRYEDGGYKWCPYLFGPQELQGLGDVFGKFGGGKYELIARANNRIAARRRFDIPGKSLPLTGPQSPERESAPTQQPPTQMPQSNEGGMATMLMQFMTIQSESNRAMMNMMMQSSANQMTAMTTLVTAMLSRDSEGSKTLIQALQANNERALQGQSQVFATMLETLGKTAGGGGDKLEAFKEGLELGATAEPDDDKDTLNNVVDGLRMVSALTGSDGAPVAAAVENAA